MIPIVVYHHQINDQLPMLTFAILGILALVLSKWLPNDVLFLTGIGVSDLKQTIFS